MPSEHGPAYPAVDGSSCPGHLVRRWVAGARCQRKSPACPPGPRVRRGEADRLDDQLVIRLRRLTEAGHVIPAEDTTADLVAELGAAAKTPEVAAAIDALRQRLHTSAGAARAAERKEGTTAATVIELHRRREIATDAFSLDDWVAEAVARGARSLYLPAGSVPFVKIDGQVAALSSDVT